MMNNVSCQNGFILLMIVPLKSKIFQSLQAMFSIEVIGHEESERERVSV